MISRLVFQSTEIFALRFLQRVDLAGPKNCFVQKEIVGSLQLGQLCGVKGCVTSKLTWSQRTARLLFLQEP